MKNLIMLCAVGMVAICPSAAAEQESGQTVGQEPTSELAQRIEEANRSISPPEAQSEEPNATAEASDLTRQIEQATRDLSAETGYDGAEGAGENDGVDEVYRDDGADNVEAAARALQGRIVDPVFTLPRWRFAIDAAASFRTGALADGTFDGLTRAETIDFMQKMRRGIAYGASITGFFGTYIGLGAKFQGNNYSSSGYGYKDVLNTFYVAPEFVARVPTRSRRNAWIFSLSVGYMAYREKFGLEGGRLLGRLNREGLKSMVDIGFDIRLSGSLFLGLKLSAGAGSVSFGGEDGNTYRESINAVEIGGGLRF